MKLLKIVSTKVGFEPYVMPVPGQPVVLMLNKTQYRNFFPERKLEDGSVIKADVLYTKIERGEAKVNTLIAGSIERLETTPYTIGNNTINQYTGVFFEGENAVAIAARNLRDNNAGVIDKTTGEVVFANQRGSVPPPTPSLNTSALPTDEDNEGVTIEEETPKIQVQRPAGSKK